MAHESKFSLVSIAKAKPSSISPTSIYSKIVQTTSPTLLWIILYIDYFKILCFLLSHIWARRGSNWICRLTTMSTWLVWADSGSLCTSLARFFFLVANKVMIRLVNFEALTYIFLLVSFKFCIFGWKFLKRY